MTDSPPHAFPRETRILVAEDEGALRGFICQNLRVRGFTVLEAANGLEAVAVWMGESPDLIILDVMMPRMDGLEVCRRVREGSTIPIIILTALDDEDDKVAALDLGADDYLTKPFGVAELLARVRANLRRSRWGSAPPSSRGLITFGGVEVDLEGRTVRLNGGEIHLTPTEFALLAELVTHPGKVLPHRLLLQRVWGPEYGNETEYLRVFVGRIRQKLEPDPSAPHYLLTEPRVGYRFMPEAER